MEQGHDVDLLGQRYFYIWLLPMCLHGSKVDHHRTMAAYQ